MDDPRASVHSLIRRNNGADKMVFGKPAKGLARTISKSMRPEEAFRATLSDCLSQITANAATLRPQESKDHRSVEGLHQLRVAFRRLEVALGAFGHWHSEDLAHVALQVFGGLGIASAHILNLRSLRSTGESAPHGAKCLVAVPVP